MNIGWGHYRYLTCCVYIEVHNTLHVFTKVLLLFILIFTSEHSDEAFNQFFPDHSFYARLCTHYTVHFFFFHRHFELNNIVLSDLQLGCTTWVNEYLDRRFYVPAISWPSTCSGLTTTIAKRRLKELSRKKYHWQLCKEVHLMGRQQTY